MKKRRALLGSGVNALLHHKARYLITHDLDMSRLDPDADLTALAHALTRSEAVGIEHRKDQYLCPTIIHVTTPSADDRDIIARHPRTIKELFAAYNWITIIEPTPPDAAPAVQFPPVASDDPIYREFRRLDRLAPADLPGETRIVLRHARYMPIERCDPQSDAGTSAILWLSHPAQQTMTAGTLPVDTKELARIVRQIHLRLDNNPEDAIGWTDVDPYMPADHLGAIDPIRDPLHVIAIGPQGTRTCESDVTNLLRGIPTVQFTGVRARPAFGDDTGRAHRFAARPETYAATVHRVLDRAEAFRPDMLLLYRGGGDQEIFERFRQSDELAQAIERALAAGIEIHLGIGHGDDAVPLPIRGRWGVVRSDTPSQAARTILDTHAPPPWPHRNTSSAA